MSAKACAECGRRLTIWNRSNRKELCVECARGRTPAEKRAEVERFLRSAGGEAGSIVGRSFFAPLGSWVLFAGGMLAASTLGGAWLGWIGALLTSFLWFHLAYKHFLQGLAHPLDRRRTTAFAVGCYAVYGLVFLPAFMVMILSIGAPGAPASRLELWFEVSLYAVAPGAVLGTALAAALDGRARRELTELARQIQPDEPGPAAVAASEPIVQVPAAARRAATGMPTLRTPAVPSAPTLPAAVAPAAAEAPKLRGPSPLAGSLAALGGRLGRVRSGAVSAIAALPGGTADRLRSARSSAGQIPGRLRAWAAQLRKGGPGAPELAAALNLTGLGIGYLFLRLWTRAVAGLAVTLGLLAVALFTPVADLTPLWLSAVVLWLPGMSADAWRRAGGSYRSLVGRRAWGAVALALALLAAQWTGAAAYLARGQEAYTAGLAGYRSGDDLAAFQGFQLAAGPYRLSLRGHWSEARALALECGLLVHAGQQAQAGEFERAVQTYRVFLDRYPSGPLRGPAQERLADTLLAWGEWLWRSGAHDAAASRLVELQALYPESDAAQIAAGRLPLVYRSWAESLLTTGHYTAVVSIYQQLAGQVDDPQPVPEQAAEVLAARAGELHRQGRYSEASLVYQLVADRYPDTSTARASTEPAARTLLAWATERLVGGDYAGSLAIFTELSGRFPQTESAQAAQVSAGSGLEQWAQALTAQGQYAAALEKYLLIERDYPDTPAGWNAAGGQAAALAQWADELTGQGDYAQSIELQRILLYHYPGTPPGQAAHAALGQAQAAWAEQLTQQGHHPEAVKLWWSVLDEYADVISAAEAREQLAEAYLLWGEDLHQSGQVEAAVQQLVTLIMNFPDSQALPRAEQAAGQAFSDWGDALIAQRHYQQAIQAFGMVPELVGDPDVRATAQAGYERAVEALARDTSGEGAEALRRALATGCRGDPAESPAVGYLKGEPGRLLMCDDGLSPPRDLLAIMPGHLQLVVKTRQGSNQIETCPYTGGHTLIRVRDWLRVEVYNPVSGKAVLTRTFEGGFPPGCPYMRSFFLSTEYQSGGPPSTQEALAWLEGLLK